VQTLLADLRHAVRQLRRTPGFVLVALLTLALGVGANAAIFSVVRAVVLRPLPYPEPDRLVFMSSQFPTLGFDKFWISPPEYLELQERQRSFTTIGAYTTGSVNLSATDRPRRVVTATVAPELLQALGVSALRGRLFNANDTVKGAPEVVILSHDLWSSAFAANERLLGQSIDVHGVQRTVVGIMPPGFDVGDARAEIFQPLNLGPDARLRRGNHFLYLVGRLRSGVTLDRARAELETLLGHWDPSVRREDGRGGHVPNQKGHRLQYAPLQEEIVGTAGTAVWVLQAAVGFVLLIACANLANLLLARAETRQREFATRLALGASRGRLLRQFLTEGVLLSVVGGTLGLIIAMLGVPALVKAYDTSLPRAVGITIDIPVMLFTFAVSIATGIVFGLAPLLHLTTDASAQSLREGNTRTTSANASHGLRRLLVAAEIALAVVLVFGAGLMLRSLFNLARVDAGFDRAPLVTFGLALPQARYPKAEEVATLYNRLTERLQGLPGVQRATIMSGLPPQRQVNANDTDIDGYTAPPNGPFENIDYYQNTTVGYVETLGVPIVEGRSFQESDRQEGAVALVNETMARTFWKGRSAVGGRVRAGFGDQPWLTVVGVIKDVKQGGVDQKTGTELYFLIDQSARLQQNVPRTINVVLRTTLPVSALEPSIRQAIQGVDPSLPIVKLRPMDDVFVESTLRPRLLAQLLTAFGGLALLLAALGTYGLLSYLVTERRREIGIRMALGAERGRVLAMVMRQGLTLAVVGVVVGLGGALLLNRVMRTLVFGVTTSDPATLAGVVMCLSIVAALACYVPARRATRVDPMVVLRQD
jgi:putative ABC transport system permease protein